MLAENQNQKHTIEQRAKMAAIKDARDKYVKMQRIKWIKRIFYILLISSIIVFPKQIGTYVGQWINNFFGTIVKESIK